MKSTLNPGKALITPASSPIFTLLFIVLFGAAVGYATIAVSNPLLIPILVIGMVVVVLSIFNTELGLLLLVFISYTRLSDILIKFHGAPSVAKFFVVLLVIVIIARWLMYGETPAGWSRAAWLIGAYGFVSLGSLLYSQDFVGAQEVFIAWVKDAIIGLVLVVLLKEGKSFRKVIWTLIIIGLMFCSLSVIQSITGTFWSDYGGFAQVGASQVTGTFHDKRVSGPIGDPNTYAQVMLVIFPLALDRFWREKSNLLKVLAGLTLIIIPITVYLTYSRGGFVAMVIMLAAIVYFYRPEFTRVVLVGLILLLAIQFLPSTYLDRISSLRLFIPGTERNIGEEGSLRGRISETLVGIQMFADHPFTGVGLDNYNANYLEYSSRLGIDKRREARSAHSLYIEVAAELGLVGLTVFFSLLYFTFKGLLDSIRDFQEIGKDQLASMTAALAIGLITYLSAAMFLHDAYPRYFWVLIGISLAVPNIVKQEKYGWKADYASE